MTRRRRLWVGLIAYKVIAERKVGKEKPPKDYSLQPTLRPAPTFIQMVGRFYDYVAARELHRRLHFWIGNLQVSQVTS